MNAKERVIDQLLKPPAVEYVRSLMALIQKDPDYVNANRVDVGNIIRGFLDGAGFFWHEEISEKEWPAIVQDAIARLESKEV